MSVDDSHTNEIADLEKRLAELDQERLNVLAALEQLKRRAAAEVKPVTLSQMVGTVASPMVLSNTEKITLFRSLFRGRDDVFPRRWENSKTGKSGYAPACHNEWVRGVCEKPRIKCSNCPNQAFVHVSETVVRSHLQGRDVANPGKAEPFVAGVYPLMTDARHYQSGSAQGWRAHPSHGNASRCQDCLSKSAAKKRTELARLGSRHGLRKEDPNVPDLGFESYDRFFPSQDTMPAGGFGNLIALPLQNGPRQNGNSVFVDNDLRPIGLRCRSQRHDRR